MLFETAKNLTLSGIKKISFFIKGLYDPNLLDKTNKHNPDPDRFFGNVHNHNYDTIIKELSALNPYCEIGIYGNQPCNNCIFVFVNYDLNSIVDLNQFLRYTAKSIAIYADNNYNFNIYVDFFNHIVTDVDGETYNISTLATIDKVDNSDNEYVVTTVEPHNLYNDELVQLEYNLNNQNHTFSTNVKRRLKANKFSIENTSELKFDYGHVRHLKQTLTLNHKPFSDIIDTNMIIKSFTLINPVVQSFLGAGGQGGIISLATKLNGENGIVVCPKVKP